MEDDKKDQGPRPRQDGSELPPEQELVLGMLRPLVGLTCELKSTTDRLLAVGRLQSVEERAIRVVADQGAAMPAVLFNSEVKMIIRPPKKPALILRGLVCGSARHMWKIDKLERFHYSEARSYFRQIVKIEAEVSKVEKYKLVPKEEAEEVQKDACTVLDLSLEGLRFRTTRQFKTGDIVHVTNLYLLPEDEMPFEMTGEICWANTGARDQFIYGCRLKSMSKPEQNTLSAAIFQLQREEIQAKRLGGKNSY